MKGAITTVKGLEFSAETELKEILGCESKISDSIIEFEFKEYSELVKLSYLSQSANKILVILDSIEFKKLEEFSSVKLDLSEWSNPETTFAVRCHKETSQNFDSSEIETLVGKNIDLKVDLNNPEIIVYVQICDNKAYFGIDVTGIDLTKRQYKIFVSTNSLKGTTAYSLLRFADVNKKEKIIDVNCRDGTLVIESAFYFTNFPLRYYDKEKLLFKQKPFSKVKVDKIFMAEDKKIKNTENVFAADELQRNVVAAQKNAKVAGVNKDINFTRTEIDWLDTKFKEGEIDKIITNFIWPTRHISLKELEKRTKELFYQANYVLSKKGSITLMTRLPDMTKEMALKDKFKVEKEKLVMVGDEKLFLLKFSK